MLSQGEYTSQDMESWANKLISAANQDATLSNVNNNISGNVPQYILDIDYAKAMAQNVDLQELYSTLSSMLVHIMLMTLTNTVVSSNKIRLKANSEIKQTDLEGIYVKK